MSVQLGTYRHFKGALYKVLHVARHSETEQEMVVYQALYGDRGIWVRPLAMFTETVDHDNRLIPRFRFLDQQQKKLDESLSE